MEFKFPKPKLGCEYHSTGCSDSREPRSEPAKGDAPHEWHFAPAKADNIICTCDKITSDASRMMSTRVRSALGTKAPVPTPVLLTEQDPSLPGDFLFCREEPYSFKNQTTTPAHNYFGQLYIPGVATTIGCAVVGTFSLVIIVHAAAMKGVDEKEFHLAYSTLAKHLATHGFIVASVNRGLDASDGWDEEIGDVLEETVQFLFTKHQIRHNLKNSISVMGHSSGGKRVLENVWRIAQPKNLYPGKVGRIVVCVIIMSCSIPVGWSEFAGTADQQAVDKIASICSAFLGICVAFDSDGSAFGAKQPKGKMKSTFWPYDLIGKMSGTKDLLRVTKDMLFIEDNELPKVGHFYQHRSFTRAFITAFLHRHVDHSAFYDNFLLLQSIPSSASTLNRYFFLHENFRKMSIATFDGKDLRLANIVESNVVAKKVTTYIDDNFSPHVSTALRIDWDRTKGPGKFSPTFVELQLNAPVNVSQFSFFSFRITQARGNNLNGPSFDVEIKLPEVGGFVVASKHGGMIHYPIFEPAPVGVTQDEQTKTAMRTYIIHLEDFNAKLTSISKIRFDFSINPPSDTARAVFYLGMVEFVP